jgi:Ca-activated chloride channel family protein
LVLAALILTACLLLLNAQLGTTGFAATSGANQATEKIEINLDRALAVKIPSGPELKAVAFETPDGKKGWAMRIPGGRPIATPAYAGGLIFFGGGYGSHEFYALNAQSGAVAWKIRTSDDGPTAAVVEDGYVVFNTESCTLVVVDAKTGKVIWEKWLGDPLMSQPAIWKGKLYIVYPAGHPRSQVRPGGQQDSGARGSHRMLCLDLRTGEFIWEQEVTGDAISAPVIADGVVYVTCFDGTTFAFQAEDGKPLWQRKNSGTSAPVISEGQLVHTRKVVAQGKSFEGLARSDAKRGREKDKDLLAREEAEYLAANKGGGVGLTATQAVTLDFSVGFSTAPAAAGLKTANENVGVNSVVGGWAYQGSRAAIHDGRILNAQGRYINALGAADGKTRWRAEVKGKALAGDRQVFTPPAIGREFMYLAGVDGHLVKIRQRDGAGEFIYQLGHAMAFQPALAAGNIYIGTADGMVICLKTGSSDADGWYAWGGNAQHNK